jgi:hypothetical protein
MKERNNNYVLLLRSCVPLISSVKNGDQIGENSRLGWLIEFPAHAICAASLYFLMVQSLSTPKIPIPSQFTEWSSS